MFESINQLHPGTSGPRPALLVGVGEFGRRVLLALDQRRAGFSSQMVLWGTWASATGWGANWQTPTASSWPDPDVWWDSHAAVGMTHLENHITHALRVGRNQKLSLPVYLAIDWMESGARALWQRIHQEVRGLIGRSFADHEFTLLIATDVRRFSHSDGLETRALRTDVATLSAVLAEETKAPEAEGRIGWCYLIDVYESRGHPLTPLKLPHHPHQPEITLDMVEWQAQLTAHWIETLVCHLQHTPAYRATCLSSVQHDLGATHPTAWVSAFGVGSVVAPLTMVSKQAETQIARRLLKEVALRPEQLTDLPKARRLRDQWRDKTPLDPGELRRELEQTGNGEPVIFETQPPPVQDVPDAHLLSYLAHWDALLWHQWQLPEGPPALLAHKADQLITANSDQLNHYLESMLHQERGGLRQAELFIREARQALEAARSRLEVASAPAESWLTVMLAPWRRPTADPTAIPDLTQAYIHLEKALKQRLNRRAVFVRATLWAVVTLLFMWVPFQVAGLALLDDSGWLQTSGWLNLPTKLFDWLLLALLCWLFWLMAGAGHILWREALISRSTELVIGAIRHKYRAFQERALRAEREGVYAGLYQVLLDWSKVVENRRKQLEAVVTELDWVSQEMTTWRPAAFELPLLWNGDYQALWPQPTDEEIQAWGTAWLQEESRSDWQQTTPTNTVSQLQRFVHQRLEIWFRQVATRVWQLPADKLDLLASLARQVTPAWPLALSDRRSLETYPLQVVKRMEGGREREPYLQRIFWLTPQIDKHIQEQPADWLPISPEAVEVIPTVDRERLTLAITLHGLALPDLRLWATLPDEGVLEEVVK